MVYNSGSPIMNNMMTGMMYQQPFIPQPMGNIMNMSPGYNMGGYYNGYNGYLNPYLVQLQKERQEQERRKLDIQDSELKKTMYRNANTAMGKHSDDMEEHLRKYDPQYLLNEKDQNEHREDYQTMHLMGLKPIEEMCTYTQALQISRLNNERERILKEFPPDMGLCDFFENYGKEEARMREMQAKIRRRDLSRSYNSGSYATMLNKTGSNPYCREYASDIMKESIDDLSIVKPNSISQEIEMRRKAFLDNIMNRR